MPMISMSREEKEKYLSLLKEKNNRIRQSRISQFFPETGPVSRHNYPKHMAFFEAGVDFPERCIMAANRIGKAFKHGTYVATPTGWLTIESLKPGDQVIAGDGSVTTVANVYPQGTKPIYEMSFDSKASIFCCAEHLWKYQHPKSRYPTRRSHGKTEANPFYGEWKLGNTQELIDTLYQKTPSTVCRAIIPSSPSWTLPNSPVPLDPYILGVLLGDGYIRKNARFSSGDEFVVNEIRKRIPFSVVVSKEAGKFGYSISLPGRQSHGKARCAGANPVLEALRSLSLIGCVSDTKFIPQDYLYNSTAVRLSLLQGLMDADGEVSPTGSPSLTTISPYLVAGVRTLVTSLGGKSSVSTRITKYKTATGEVRTGQLAYRIGIKIPVCPFLLPRKANVWVKADKVSDFFLYDIKPAGEAECTCIEVTHESHTFVVEGGIVTHNSESIGAYETTCHLTGRYPTWWKGYRFDRPVNVWACGTTGTTARDIVQYKLIGPPEDFGTGLLPKKYITKTTPKAGGVPNAVDTILIKHISGGMSRCKIKSYAEGRKSFEGTEQDLIWLDEECPMSIYTECVTRTMTTNGLIMLTFTPLEGMTDTVMQFMPDGQLMENQVGGKCLITATWEDAPHLTQKQKDKLYAALPPHQREARSKGVPQLGSGAIYPILESNITATDFPIPDHWLRCYGMDVGWNKTACLWCATDPDSAISYLYSSYYQGAAEPIIHAEGIKSRGTWIPGVIDHAAHGRSQVDGQNLFDIYYNLGLDISNANKAVEAGIYNVWQMLSLGKLKVFASLLPWFTEFRQYCRDENGKIMKKNDHLMDCTRYLVMSGLSRAIPRPFWEHMAWEESDYETNYSVNATTGY